MSYDTTENSSQQLVLFTEAELDAFVEEMNSDAVYKRYLAYHSYLREYAARCADGYLDASEA